MKESNEQHWRSSLKRGYKLAVGAVSVIVLLMTAYHGLNFLIDSRIENKINDLTFLKFSAILFPQLEKETVMLAQRLFTNYYQLNMRYEN